MEVNRELHPDFWKYLKYKDQELIDLYTDLRNFVWSIHPECNELLYHTHALTSVYSISEKLRGSFCMIPIYTNHLNLGFNKGTLLEDSSNLLKGTGKLIRHIVINDKNDYRNNDVKKLIKSAIEISMEDTNNPIKKGGLVISKIK